MSRYATFGNSLLAAGNTLHNGHARRHEMVGLDIQDAGAWGPVLRDQDGAFNVRKDGGRLTFERGDKLGTHEVTLKYHFLWRKRRSPPNTRPKPSQELAAGVFDLE